MRAVVWGALALAFIGGCADSVDRSIDARVGEQQDFGEVPVADLAALDAASLDVGVDGGAVDRGQPDATSLDAMGVDAAVIDGALADGAVVDAAPVDVALPDMPSLDGGLPDAEPPDADAPDADAPDIEAPDMALPDIDLPDTRPADAEVPDASPPAPLGPGVILVVAPGLDPETRAALAADLGPRYLLDDLPFHARLHPATRSGVPDAPAVITALATGRTTLAGYVGRAPDGRAAQTLLELALTRGLGAGLVTTAALTAPAVAGWYAHGWRGDPDGDRGDALVARPPTVMLGGGAAAFPDGGERRALLRRAGFDIVDTADGLAGVDLAVGRRLAGFFAEGPLDYAAERPADGRQPTLSTMAAAALEALDRSPEGFVLVIDAGRVDSAVRGAEPERALAEARAWHAAAEAAVLWAAGRPQTTVFITAGYGLGATDPRFAERLEPVDVFGLGPGVEGLDPAGWPADLGVGAVHALARAALLEAPVELPPRVLRPDGDLRDLRWRAIDQRYVTNFGPGFNQLDGLSVDADEAVLAVGLSGAFEQRLEPAQGNATVVLIDVDLGAGTGRPALDARLGDRDGAADRAISAPTLGAPPVAGVGFDFAAVSRGAAAIRRLAPEEPADLVPFGGLRALDPPGNYPWLPLAASIDPAAIARPPAPAVEVVATRGLELHVPWSALFPDGPPAEARLGLVALLGNGEGCVSNQLLPPLPDDPGPTDCAVAQPDTLPGVVEVIVRWGPDGVELDPPRVLTAP